MTGPNPSGLCLCGCGQAAPLARQTRRALGLVGGEPVRYLHGHATRKGSVEYLVDPETGCWVWQLSTFPSGYGQMVSDGERVAHRVYYVRHVGPIPEGLQLDHLCRNRSCVNPAHLEAVTNAENVRRGDAAKLTREDAEAIRASTEPGVALARRYGVSQALICGIRKGRKWAAA